MKPNLMHRLTPRFYYGWIVVAISFITMMFVLGTFVSSGVLFAALIQEYGWSRATTSFPFSLALVVYAATAWLSGRLFDRYGPRWLFPIGIVCLGLGLIASAYARTPWQLRLTWGLFVAQGFNLAGFVPHVALISLWFRRRLGVATGLAVSGASVGTLTIVPAMQYWVDHIGWRAAYIWLGCIMILCLVPLNVLWQRHHPGDLGVVPDRAPATGGASASDQTDVSERTAWTLPAALRTSRFWFVFIMVCGIGWQTNMVSVHLIAHITDNGFSSMLAASMFGFIGLFRAGSATIWGGLSDRFGREVIYTVGSGLCIVGLLGLTGITTHPAMLWLLYGSILAIGVGYGVHGSVEASATADLFHGPSLGAILGALELGWGIGGFLGAWLGGFWYDTWASYHGVFAVTGLASAVGCTALWIAAPRRPMPPAPKLTEA